MGRTVTPYSMQVERVQNRFQQFRRALRKKDQHTFDQIIRQSKVQIQAGVMASNPNPADSMFMSILIAQQNLIQDLEYRIDRLEESLDSMKVEVECRPLPQFISHT